MGCRLSLQKVTKRRVKHFSHPSSTEVRTGLITAHTFSNTSTHTHAHTHCHFLITRFPFPLSRTKMSPSALWSRTVLSQHYIYNTVIEVQYLGTQWWLNDYHLFSLSLSQFSKSISNLKHIKKKKQLWNKNSELITTHSWQGLGRPIPVHAFINNSDQQSLLKSK